MKTNEEFDYTTFDFTIRKNQHEKTIQFICLKQYFPKKLLSREKNKRETLKVNLVKKNYLD